MKDKHILGAGRGVGSNEPAEGPGRPHGPTSQLAPPTSPWGPPPQIIPPRPVLKGCQPQKSDPWVAVFCAAALGTVFLPLVIWSAKSWWRALLWAIAE